MDQFSDRITFARKRLGLSQAQLASILGVSRGACGQWEQGVSTPCVAHMSELARVTEISFEWLATGRGTHDTDIHMDIKTNASDKKNISIIAGRHLTGDLREIMLWLQKLPDDKRDSVIKLLRNVRNLMG